MKNARIRGLGLAFAAITASQLFAQTTYDWTSSSTGGLWSSAGNWTPSSAAPDALDTANLNAATANRVITYDAGASGSLAALNITQTGAFSNTLTLEQSLSVTAGISLSATGGGSSVLNIDATGSTQVVLTTPTLSVGSGGSLLLNAGTTNATAPRINGDVTIGSGGALTISRGPSAASTYLPTFNGALTIQDGSTLSLYPVGGSSTDNRIAVNGNFTATTNTNFVSGQLWHLYGATNSISGTFTPGSGTIILFADGDQSLKTTGSVTASTHLRSTGDAVKTVGAIVDGATMSSGSFSFGQGTSGATTTLKLSSNVTQRQYGSMPGLTAAGNVNGGRYAVDVNGFTWNISGAVPSSSNRTLTAAGSANNTAAVWTYTNSSATVGTIRAGAFNLNGTNLASSSVGAKVILEANGTGNSLANNLGGPAGTIDAASTFRYIGTATTATLTSNRTIGGLSVASGELTLVTAALATAGDVAIGDTTAGVGTLNLAGQNLTLTGSGKLTGAGTITDSIGSGVVSFASGATGGLAVGNSGVGTLTFGGTVGGLNLANASVSTFEIASLSSFDSVALGGRAITYGGSLALSFLGGYLPTAGETYALFGNSGSVAGTFTNISSNISGFDFSFDTGTGLLSVSAIPEPSSAAALLGAGVAGLALVRRRRRG